MYRTIENRPELIGDDKQNKTNKTKVYITIDMNYSYLWMHDSKLMVRYMW